MKGTTWKIILFAAIIIILYIPLVFMGANIFFPKYDYTNYPMYNECYMSKPMPVNGYDNTTQEQINKCQQEQNKIQQDYEKQKRTYDGWKYLSIVIFCLLTIGAALLLKLNDSVMYGLFLGATITTFASTIIYFTTRSKIGFAILVLIFITTIFFITKRKDN
ncbi:MAG TPA: hypothetical protein HA226_01475 [Nanoarchaeota archaeon]|nr:hypothetical protein [Nanoarchaeota archaeon]